MSGLDETRFCSDIGMLSIDRPIPSSCVHKTAYCDAKCYNVKLYKMYKAMRTKDVRSEAAWNTNIGTDWRSIFDRKRRDTSRIRLMTRGEAFSNLGDVRRVRDMALANPERTFWIPTRGWRHALVRAAIESLSGELDNVAILASLDPSNTEEEIEGLIAAGWSTMFFGNDSETPTAKHARPFKCPKTWGDVHGACVKCVNGCFKPVTKGQRVDVWLSEH